LEFPLPLTYRKMCVLCGIVVPFFKFVVFVTAFAVRGRYVNRFYITLLASYCHHFNTYAMSVVESVGVAVGSMFPTSVELKIYYMLYAAHQLYLLLPVLRCYIEHLVGVKLFLSSSSTSPPPHLHPPTPTERFIVHILCHSYVGATFTTRFLIF